MDKMEEKFQNSFQDANELTQATQFLHENGMYFSLCSLNGIKSFFCGMMRMNTQFIQLSYPFLFIAVRGTLAAVYHGDTFVSTKQHIIATAA